MIADVIDRRPGRRLLVPLLCLSLWGLATSRRPQACKSVASAAQ
ncbi:hypothetical protein MICRO80W_210086 [Micrococcus luteus]|nr:hypothetical protein MICRO116_550036 [Micrococcus sp. 116]VWX50032.1 hypothetical protein MICRO80W_210086 [Micrococcus luteus]